MCAVRKRDASLLIGKSLSVKVAIDLTGWAPAVITRGARILSGLHGGLRSEVGAFWVLVGRRSH